MRAFLAIPLPDEVQTALAAVRDGVPGLRPVRKEQLHLTMMFLGEIDERTEISVGAAVGKVTRAHAPFQLELARVGCFPNPKRARVVWVGLGDGQLQVGALAAGLETALAPLGFRPERATWHGHVTLGRFPLPQRMPEGVLDETARLGRFWAEHLVLYKSQLHSAGPIYTQRKRFFLSETAST